MCHLVIQDEKVVDLAKDQLRVHLNDAISSATSASSSAASASAADASSPTLQLSIGQLFVLLYRLAGGQKCFIYSQDDALTTVKMAQMKLGKEVCQIQREREKLKEER